MTKSIERLEAEVRLAWERMPATNIDMALAFERRAAYNKAKAALRRAQKRAH